MILAVVIGCGVGILGTFPLVSFNRIGKSLRRRGKDLTIGHVLVLVFVSLAFLSVMIYVGHVAAPDFLVPYTVAMVIAFLAAVCVYSIPRALRSPRRK